MNESVPPPADRSRRSARFFNYLHRYKNLLRKRWWVLPITMALGLGVQGFRLWREPVRYISVGQMIMSIQIKPGATGVGISEEFANFLGTQVALMKSPGVAEKAQLRVKALHPSLAATPGLFMRATC